MTPAELAEMENLQHRLDQALADVARLRAALEGQVIRNPEIAAAYEAVGLMYTMLKLLPVEVPSAPPSLRELCAQTSAKARATCLPYVDLEGIVGPLIKLARQAPRGQA